MQPNATLVPQPTTNTQIHFAHVIYAFRDIENARLFANACIEISDNVSLFTEHNCVAACSNRPFIDSFMLSVDTLMEDFNQNILFGQAPGWLYNYNMQKNFGCTSIKRLSEHSTADVLTLCGELSVANNAQSNALMEHQYATLSTLDDAGLATRIYHSLPINDATISLSPSLIQGWLRTARSFIKPSYLIAPSFISDTFITPISSSYLSQNHPSVKSLSAKVQMSIANQHAERIFAREKLVHYFNEMLNQHCVSVSLDDIELSNILSHHYLALSAQQLMQRLMKDYSKLCETGPVSTEDMKQPLIKHLKITL